MGLVSFLSFIHKVVSPSRVRSINAIIVMRSYSCAVSTAGAGRIKCTKNRQIIELAMMKRRISIFLKLPVEIPWPHFSKYPPLVTENILLFAGSFCPAVFRLLPPSSPYALCGSNSCADTLLGHSLKICVDLATVSQVKLQVKNWSCLLNN